MDVTVANLSTKIRDAEFNAAVQAIGSQVANHFQPEWGTGGILRATRLSITGPAPIATDPDAIIYVGDAVQDPTTGVSGVIGYHTAQHGDMPYGFVYLDIAAEYREAWTVTLSHEVLELLADPDATQTLAGPAPENPGGGPVQYDLEVCDPTQGDSYQIGSIDVSNFVGKSYFGIAGGSGKTNYLTLPLKPFGVRPKGYCQYEKDGQSETIQGAEVTAEQMAAKALMAMGRRNFRRNHRRRKSLEARAEG